MDGDIQVRRYAVGCFMVGEIFDFPTRLMRNFHGEWIPDRLYVLEECSLEEDRQTYKLVLRRLSTEEKLAWKIINA